MFNFLKKKSREFNLPEQVLPYKLEELRDLFMRVSQDGRYHTVGATTMRDMISHINKMYTNVSPIIIPDTPEALAIKLNDLTGVALNRFRNVTTIDKAISLLYRLTSGDITKYIPYPIFEVIIDNLILNSNSYSSERIDLKALKMDVTRLWKASRLKYTVDKVEHWDNSKGYVIIGLIERLREIKKEKSTMHVTFDDVISSLTSSDDPVYITHAQSYIYHLKETYKDKAKTSRYLDYVDHKLTKLSMRDEKGLPLETFYQFIITGRDIDEDKNDFDKLINQLERGDFAYMTTLESLPSTSQLVAMDDAINIINVLSNRYTDIQINSYLATIMKQLQQSVSNGDYYVSRNYMLESIRKAKYIYQDTVTQTVVTGAFSVHDHIPTVAEKLKETRDNDIKWTISAKEELVKWYNTLPNNSVYSEARLSEKDYPKAYHLLAVYPEYLTNKGYTLETTMQRHYTNKGEELTPVNTIIVSWGTAKMKALLAFVLDGTYDYETKQSI